MMKQLYRLKVEQPSDLLFSVNELFGNAVEMDELDKVSEYYKHQDGWTNRMILGDSLLTMTSLLEREGMKGRVQCIYIDPPYGIKYGSNWQIKLNNREVKDGADDNLSGEPEQIKAYRDTWELGIHSYLSYIRDRLLVAKELLTESGSCFVQISDENVHLVRNLMDEVFGSENFVSQIAFVKTSGFSPSLLSNITDHLVWYSKNVRQVKYRPIWIDKTAGEVGATQYSWVESSNGKERRQLTDGENLEKLLSEGFRLFAHGDMSSQGVSGNTEPFKYVDTLCVPPNNCHWKTTPTGMQSLLTKNRLMLLGKSLRYKRYFEDFPVFPLTNAWNDTGISGFGDKKRYVVQTGSFIIQRCILMTTDPGDLVLDPTCGSGTAAYVCEQWGRRWITIDTSRIALNIAKTRLMTASFPYFQLADEKTKDIRHGFVYKKVPHITLKSLANDEQAEEETLYDQPLEEKKKLRVTGPFTVETLQSYDPIPLSALDEHGEFDENFEKRIFEHLATAGIRNGARNEQAVFSRIESLPGANLHAAGYFMRLDNGKEHEAKAYFLIGPKFGSVSKRAVSEAAKEARAAGDADWLVILGFAFDSDLDSLTDKSMGTYEISKVRMHDDLLQEGLLKKDKKAATFVTIGEPDIDTHPLDNGFIQVEIHGLDIYDPIKDLVKPRDLHDIAYWMVDDDYDGSNFIVRQVFFCGGDKDEFDKWRKGLDSLAVQKAKKNLEDTLKIEIDDEAFERLYGFKSHPIMVEPGKARKIAVRVVSQFGEESTKVMQI